MNGTKKFVDVAKEAMGKGQSDKLLKGVRVSEIGKTFEYVVKSSKVSLKFEWKRMKGLNSKNKLWNMNSFKSGIAN